MRKCLSAGTFALAAFLFLAAPALADWKTATVGVGNTIYGNVSIDPVRNRIFVPNHASGTISVVDGKNNIVQTWTAGSQPRCTAFNPITGKLYVSINGSATNDTVVIFDSLGSVVNKLPVKRTPASMVIDADSNRLYVANYDSDTISIFDEDVWWVSYPVKDRPRNIALNPVNHALYITYESSDSIGTFNPGVYGLMHLWSGKRAYSVAINASVNKAYVTNTDEDSVTVFDCSPVMPVPYNKISVGDYPTAVVCDPSAKTAYVANYLSGTVTAINCSTNTSAGSALVKTFPNAMAVNPVTRKLYVGNDISTPVLMILDWRSGVVRDSVLLGHAPSAVALNPVTNRIYVTMEAGNPDSLAVIDGADYKLTITDSKDNASPSATVNQITGDAYFTNYSADNVTVVKANGDTLTIPVGDQPNDAAVNPLTNKVFVLNQAGKSVSVINGTTYSVERTVTVDSNSASIDVNPLTNYIYVSGGYNSNRIKVIDGKDWDTTSILIGWNPSLVKVNPATNRIYVGSFMGGYVYVVDGARHVVIDTVNAGYQLNDIAVNPVTNKIYCANWGDDNVTVINGADNTAVNVAAGDSPAKVAVNAALNKVYVSNFYGNTVTEIDGTNNNTTTIAVGSHPTSMVADPVTGKVFVCNSWDSTVTIIDCASRDTMSLTVAGSPWDVAIDPARGKVFAATRAYKVGIIDQTVEQDTRVITYDDGGTTTWKNVFPGSNQNRDVTTINHWKPYKTKVSRGFFSLASSQSFWKFGINPSSTDSSLAWLTGNSWGADTALFGDNVYRRSALESQSANTNNLGSGTPFVGNITTDVMYRLDYPNGPTIAWWDSLPDDNTSADGYGPYTVKAVITDFSGIDTANLYYELSAVSMPRVKLTRGTADTFSAVIPATTVMPESTKTIQYNLHTWDHAHNPYGTANYRSVNARHFFLRNITGVAGTPSDPTLPRTFALQAAYPNPSRGQTIIKYQLPKASNVQLQVYNVTGQLVKTINEGQKPAGYYQIKLSDNMLSNGIYFYRLQAGEFSATKKLVLVR